MHFHATHTDGADSESEACLDVYRLQPQSLKPKQSHVPWLAYQNSKVSCISLTNVLSVEDADAALQVSSQSSDTWYQKGYSLYHLKQFTHAVRLHTASSGCPACPLQGFGLLHGSLLFWGAAAPRVAR